MLRSQSGSRLYLENYVSPLRRVKGDGIVKVVENTTFQCAREMCARFSKIAVLNFANPHEPGGGVKRGAMAQEEKAMQCYAILTKEEKRAILKRAHSARSEKEMRQIVMSIAGKQ